MNQDEQTIDYRSTLNLPKTDFSMRAGLVQKEPLFLKKWEDSKLYEHLRAEAKGQKTFLLHDGPPYANGDIHIGHALNKILKDMIIKFRTMQGYDALYIPGWDCHGLPIEHKLLKEMKQHKSDVDCVEFRKKAHDYALNYVDIQKEQFKRLGIFGQWDDPYLTLDKNYEYWILKSLSRLQSKGYIYRGLKPVNWCFSCETALAEAEVEYENHRSPTVFVKFPIKNAEDLQVSIDKNVSLLVWTTTPWTLVANVAVAVHGSFQYALVDIGEEYIVLEQSLVDSVLNKAGIEKFSIIKTFEGRELTKLTYAHPITTDKTCSVVTADYVTKEDGTGLVHTAPGHGQDDYQTGLKNNLEIIMPVDGRGIYTQQAGEFAGQHVLKANAAIIDYLIAQQLLLHTEEIQHSYPHCWRCKKPIIFRATQQWFLNIDHDNLRGNLKKTIHEQVQWIPPSGEERITSMVTGRPDWCLSRQRYWGVPIPALKPKGSEDHYLYPEVIDHFADLVKKQGSDAWFTSDVKDLVPKGFKCPHTGSQEFEKTFDILDVWFDSGVSHQAVIKDKMSASLPADLYLEGSDQHRGWFQSSLIPAVAMEGMAPYKAVLTHGFVVDAQGRKMSKSLGNVVSPHKIIKQSGADILRLFVAASSYNEDIRVSDEIMARLVDRYRKIRNTIRYLLGNIYDFNPETDILEYKDLTELDQWALNCLSECILEVQGQYESYSFAKAFKSIYTFCNEDLSNFYLDILKDRLYISAAQSRERRSAQTVLYHILKQLVAYLAPMMCFTSEEIFEHMPHDKQTKDVQSVHALKWNDLPEQWRNVESQKRFELLIELRPLVMKALEEKRKEGVIGSSLEAKVSFKTTSKRDFEYLSSFGDDLPDLFIVSQAEIEKTDSIQEQAGSGFEETEIIISKAEGLKCARSWKYSTDVGEDPDHPTLSLKSARIVKELMHGRKENG